MNLNKYVLIKNKVPIHTPIADTKMMFKETLLGRDWWRPDGNRALKELFTAEADNFMQRAHKKPFKDKQNYSSKQCPRNADGWDTLKMGSFIWPEHLVGKVKTSPETRVGYKNVLEPHEFRYIK